MAQIPSSLAVLHVGAGWARGPFGGYSGAPLGQCRMATVSLNLERQNARKVFLNDPFARFSQRRGRRRWRRAGG